MIIDSHHDSLAFKAAWVGRPVRPDQAVDTELGIVDRVPKVAAVAPVLHLLASLLRGGDYTLVHPIPNEASLPHTAQP
jgi:hypothetical protein